MGLREELIDDIQCKMVSQISYNNKYKGMANQAQTVTLPQQKGKLILTKRPKIDIFMNQFSISAVKKTKFSLDKIIWLNNGRKLCRRRSLQINSKYIKDSKSQNVVKYFNRSILQQKRMQNCQLNITNYKGNYNKKVKKITHNFSCSSERQQDNDSVKINKEIKEEKGEYTNKNGFIQQAKKSNLLFDKSMNEKSSNKQSFTSAIYKDKNSRKLSINQKGSFLDLINKYRFQNLKIDSFNTASHQSSPPKKSIQIVSTTFSSTQAEDPNIAQSSSLSYKQIEKMQTAKKFKKILKKIDSILSPWRTAIDQPFTNQSPFA